jgi:molybdopterin-binding protein
MGNKMKISVRNVLRGKVKRENYGSVSSEVIVELPDGVENPYEANP